MSWGATSPFFKLLTVKLKLKILPNMLYATCLKMDVCLCCVFCFGTRFLHDLSPIFQATQMHKDFLRSYGKGKAMSMIQSLFIRSIWILKTKFPFKSCYHLFMNKNQLRGIQVGFFNFPIQGYLAFFVFSAHFSVCAFIGFRAPLLNILAEPIKDLQLGCWLGLGFRV